jgi:hypothetical protein
MCLLIFHKQTFLRLVLSFDLWVYNRLPSSVCSSCSSRPWLSAVTIFLHTNCCLPNTFHSLLPIRSVGPGYGDNVYECDDLRLLIAIDLRLGPILRPCRVSSVAFACRGNTYNSTTQLDDDIFTMTRSSYHNICSTG